MKKKVNTNFVKIVSLLNKGDYHAGETIGDKLQVTRSAVWKVIKKLQGYGVKVDSIKGKGYALEAPLILLDASKIKSLLNNKKVALHLFESVDSTNDYLRSLKQSQHIQICLAEQQTAGKGRLGREWYSPFAQNIYLSCLYPFQKDISELAGLSLVVTLAIIRALKKNGVTENLFAKWPNDIIYDHKKLSGNLIEVQAESHGASRAVIGVGINVNMLSDDKEIQQPWTSMQKILNTYNDRNKICADVINELLSCLDMFNQKGFAVFIDEWIAADSLSKQVVSIKNANHKVIGKVVGVNEQGYLMLRLQDGKVQTFSAGDTTIIK